MTPKGQILILNGTDLLLAVGGRPGGGGMAGRLLDFLISLASKKSFENLLKTIRFELEAVQVATGVLFMDFARVCRMGLVTNAQGVVVVGIRLRSRALLDMSTKG